MGRIRRSTRRSWSGWSVRSAGRRRSLLVSFEPSAQSITNWVVQAEMTASAAGLTTDEKAVTGDPNQVQLGLTGTGPSKTPLQCSGPQRVVGSRHHLCPDPDRIRLPRHRARRVQPPHRRLVLRTPQEAAHRLRSCRMQRHRETRNGSRPPGR